MNIAKQIGLRSAYDELYFWINNRESCKNKRKVDELILKYKRDIRAYHKDTEAKGRVIRDYEDGSEIVKVELPPDIVSKEDAENFFNKYMRIEMRPSQYDCTGQLFTSWHRVFMVNGKYICYHCIGIDV